MSTARTRDLDKVRPIEVHPGDVLSLDTLDEDLKVVSEEVTVVEVKTNDRNHARLLVFADGTTSRWLQPTQWVYRVKRDVSLVRINEPGDLALFADQHRLRPDWHEPDEQEVSARVVGDHLDNAMGPTVDHNCGELNVVLIKEGKDVAVVNLATLLAWATERGREDVL